MNSMRKMAHIETIRELHSIPSADKIMMAQVLDWELVVKTGEFKEGDRCVYVEIDSLLPDSNEQFSFMEPRKYRVKTAKLRGQISQGICFPISLLPEEFRNLEEGTDVSEILNIIKYEPPIHASLRGKVKGNFPSFLHKTDEPRIQGCGWILEVYAGHLMYVSEKLDGASISFFLKDEEFGVCSRNLHLKEDDEDKFRNAFWIISTNLEIEKRLKSINMNIALQGELCGPNIQYNRLKFPELKCLFYNVYDIDKSQYFDYEDFIRIVKELELETVPIIEKEFEINHSPQELIQMAIGNSAIHSNSMREGLVFRSKKEIDIPRHGRFSFKAINSKYLLKYE